MSYAERNLAPGETVRYRARYHWILYRTSALLLLLALLLGISALYASRVALQPDVGRWVGLLAIAFLVMAAGTFAVRRLRASADEFVLTNRRVIRKVGLISREVQQAPVRSVQDVTVEQSALGRMLGYGDVVIETASERGALVFPAIADPDGFRNRFWGEGVPDAASAEPAPDAAAPPAAERLARLEELKRRGLVTGEEYAAKRREIVERL
jgi:uncharacterized membrane protein YdbT with pleckstrin-like domain